MVTFPTAVSQSTWPWQKYFGAVFAMTKSDNKHRNFATRKKKQMRLRFQMANVDRESTTVRPLVYYKKSRATLMQPILQKQCPAAIAFSIVGWRLCSCASVSFFENQLLTTFGWVRHVSVWAVQESHSSPASFSPMDHLPPKPSVPHPSKRWAFATSLQNLPLSIHSTDIRYEGHCPDTMACGMFARSVSPQ